MNTGSEAGCRTAIGLMSGTSMDGVDAALIRTDGRMRVRPLGFVNCPYAPAFRSRLRGALGATGPVDAVERELTLRHAAAVSALLARTGWRREAVDLIGFHGHTLLHRPDEGVTRQIGDGALLAWLTGIDTVCDLRAADIAAGGQGAPLAPVYHRALTRGLERPVLVANIGGVANITWIGKGDAVLLGFDTGPGNALVDDWMLRHTGAPFDRDGAMAAAGQVDRDRLRRLMAHGWFDRAPPKSLDRDDFARHAAPVLAGLGAADGAALLTAFTAECLAAARRHLPAPPKRWIVTGGGRHNRTLMAMLARRVGAAMVAAEQAGWRGDALEAEAFAYLALRSRLDLPLSFPGTTGVARPVTGGRFFAAP